MNREMDDNSLYLIGGGLVAILVAVGMLLTNKGSGASTSGAGTGSVQKEVPYPGGKMSIYFGSQTGTAEGFARTLMEEGRERGFDAQTYDLEDFEPEQLAASPSAIFLMATYGEGEPTDNATGFTKWLSNAEGEVTDNFLGSTQFAVFGLGNRQYEHFNKQGKLTNKNMALLGATRMHTYGEGDDDGTLEEDFENWREKLWPAVTEKFGLTNGGDTGHQDGTVKKINLNFRTKNVSGGRPKSPPASQMNSSTKHFFTAASALVVENRELRSGRSEHGSTRHVEIDLKKTGVSYETADNLAVLPHNDSAAVEALAANMGYNLDQLVVCEAAATATQPYKHMFPSPCSVRDILTKYLDISGHVRHGSAHHLLAYVEDAGQRSWLQELTSKENRHAFKSNIEDGVVGFADLLCGQGELSSARIPLDDLMHIVPFLQPRYYTISSSSSLHPTTVHITVSVTEYPLSGVSNITGQKKVFKGVCSSFLAGLAPGTDRCSVFVRPSTFRLPKSLDIPIIMVGPGTGIAPMRALLQEREKRGKVGKAGSNTLFFGCRKPTEDYIYRDELETYETSGTLSKLHLAFSRETREKVYVQKLLASPLVAGDVCNDVSLGAYIYVCGATNMGTDVMDTFVKLFASQYHISTAQATDMVKDLQKKGRYVQELWTA